MPLTQLETEMRAIARGRVAEGQLPRQAPLRSWTGPGSGHPCAVCDKTTHPDDTEYEDEHQLEEGTKVFRYHMLCQAAWQLECVRLGYLTKRSTTPSLDW